MFASKLVICTALLMLSGSVLSQSLLSLKDAKIGEDHPQPDTTTTTTTPRTTKLTTTTTTTTSKPPTPDTTTTTTTSTPAPKTTTTPAPVPTTTHAPQPYPEPSVGTWNATCILLKMAAQFNFTYETKDGNYSHGLLNVPSNATIGDHVCDSKTIQSIELTWGSNTSVESITLQFTKRNDSVVMSQILIHFTVPVDDYPDAKEGQTIQLFHNSTGEFKTPENMSYHCTRAQKLNMTETVDSQKEIGWIRVSQVQVEAFLSEKANGFSTVHDCDSSETSDVVPIAVGIALAGLILVVLISYLCARRRSTSRGYMSF
ncbi:lysosome-associated membrane glycoprotein 1 [Drosophila bipectinata]|uniref:lysosome-associated membrane glycoprotein 1 n=1 Tax=Drosophila bipectinata TaxID=42026 RepID=UPI0007E8384D|nr:lysosome-associated membrane glycoprotein 1 [Drosophila bipectinata]